MNIPNNTPKGIVIPEGEYFYIYDENEKTDIKIILFGGKIKYGEEILSVPGIVNEVKDEMNNYRENIELHQNRLQGLVNAFVSFFEEQNNTRRYSNAKIHRKQLQSYLTELYGYLGDFPEILEKRKKGRVIPNTASVSQLIYTAKQLQAQKRRQEIGNKFTEKVLEILGLREVNIETQEYLIKSYGSKKSPHRKKLEELGLSNDIVQVISEQCNYIKMQAFFHEYEKCIGENEGYQLYEMFTLEHLERETDFTNHCVGRSEHYIRKINEGKVRLFSLRKGEQRITLEYDIVNNYLIQMETKKDGNKQVFISLAELETALDVFHSNGFEGVGFHASKVEELRQKENFLVGHNLEGNILSVCDYNGEDTLENMRIVSGSVRCTKNTTERELLILCEFDVDLDVTDIPQKIKNKIVHVNGSLQDASLPTVQMKNLEYVKKDLFFGSASTLILPKLQIVGGDCDCYEAEKLDALSLVKIGGKWKTPNIEDINHPELNFVGGDWLCKKSKTINTPKLGEIGGSFTLKDIVNGNFSNLTKCPIIYISNDTSLIAPHLLKIIYRVGKQVLPIL